MPDTPNELSIRPVVDFLNAERWSVMVDILETHKLALWGASADAVFVRLLEQYEDDPRTLAHINRRWEILRTAREKGIPAAYEKAQGIGSAMVIDPETMRLFQQAIESGDQRQLDDALDRHPEMVRVLKHLTDAGSKPQSK